MLLLAGLEWYARTVGKNSDALAPPTATVKAFWQALLSTGEVSILQATAFTLGSAAAGLALGALAVRSRSLLPSVTLHLVYNLLIWGASPFLDEAIEAPIAWIAVACCLVIAPKLMWRVAPSGQFT